MASDRRRSFRCALLCVVAASISSVACAMPAAMDTQSQADELGAVRRCPRIEPLVTSRRSTTAEPAPYVAEPCDPTRLPAAEAGAAGDPFVVPDRWRLVSALGYPESIRDPYHGNNWLKGDRPVFGGDWFVSFTGVSDTVLEPRRFPVPVGSPVTDRADSLDLIGRGEQLVAAQTLLAELVVYKGDTVFKPPEYEFRFIPVFNIAHVGARERGLVKANPDFGRSRTEAVLGIQSLFIDKHLRDVSERYDFDSLRIGIQPFTTDFRGFLFNDSPLGIRLFGTRANNRYQYNLGWFVRFDKDATTQLNDVVQRGAAALRNDTLVAGNLYVQDWPRLGFTTQVIAVHNSNREGDEFQYDDHGILQRPASLGREQGSDYRVTYVGANGDGHLGSYNLSASLYLAAGQIERGPFSGRREQIRAAFVATELSRDFSWIRARLSFLYASGDRDPFDDRATGFDAIFENPLFAGADTSFWIRQPVPLIGGGRVGLSARNGLLNSLRSSKEYGQSNFVNPGTALLGVGADIDLTPQMRLSVNANYLGFTDVSVLEVARAQAPIDRSIGMDVSASLIWRPFATQNVVARLSAASLLPYRGFRQLYGSERPYSVLGNLVLQY